MAAARPSQCKKMIVLLFCRRRRGRSQQQLQHQEDISNQPRARGSEARAAQVQLDKVTGTLSLREILLAESQVAAVTQATMAAAAASLSGGAHS